MTDTPPANPEWPDEVRHPADASAAADPGSSADSAPPVGPPRRSRASVAARVVVTLVIASLVGLSAYLVSVHAQYVSQNHQLREKATSLGVQVAQAGAKNEQQAAELALVETQLAQAKDRISSLANEAAQAGDDRLALVDVAASLVTCADQRQTLIGYLKHASLYTPASLRASEAQITTYCDNAERVYNQILSGG